MFWSYLKIGYKVLLRRKFFTFISLFGICFTLVALMVFSSFADQIVNPPGPRAREDGKPILGIYQFQMESTKREWVYRGELGFYFLDRYVRQMETPEMISLYTVNTTTNAFRGETKIEAEFRRADANYWKVLNFQFVEGQPYSHDDETQARAVVVISQKLKRRYFGTQPAVGETLRVGGRNYVVRGVVKDVSILDYEAYADVWAPVTTFEDSSYQEQIFGGFQAILLASDTSAIPKIRDELAGMVPHVVLPPHEEYDVMFVNADTRLEAFAREVNDEYRSADSGLTKVIMGVTGLMFLFMLLPAINLININVSRIMERAGEIGVRKAFGASSGSLVFQLVVENVMLTAVGGLISCLLVPLVFSPINSSGFIPNLHLQLNPRILLCGIFLILVFGVLSGIYPAWKMSRLHPVKALKGGDQ